MATNPIPRKLSHKTDMADAIAKGLLHLQNVIGIEQNTATRVRADRTAALDAEYDFHVKQQRKIEAVAAQNRADQAGREFILTAKSVLERFLGRQWSLAWAPAGFVNGSTAVPTRIDRRQTCLATLKIYFTQNPTQEIPALDITAAQAAHLYTELAAKRHAVNEAISLMGQARDTRDDAVTKLERRLSGTLHELKQLLAPDDHRWHAFGLRRPSDEETPAAPEDLVAIPGPDNRVLLQWPPTPGAERFRIWQRVNGPNAAFHPVATAYDTQATLFAPTPENGTVTELEFRLTALNAAGESLPSAPVHVSIPEPPLALLEHPVL